jgi:AraC-like DNA-binding protein
MEDIETGRGDGETAEGPHRHNYFTIIWVLEGEGTHYIDFKAYPIAPGTIFFVNPGQVHHVELISRPKGYVILFTEDFLLQNGIPLEFMNGLRLFYACDEVRAIHPDEGTRGRLEGYITQIMAEFHADHSLKNEGISAWLKLFLIECKRIKTEQMPGQASGAAGPARIVKEFKENVERHFRSRHKVSDYAAMMAITSNYLNEVIKSETGTSAKDFIQNRIVLEAKRLAIFSGISLKEAAYELGFDDPAHFSKFIKKQLGQSFSEMKEQMHISYT